MYTIIDIESNGAGYRKESMIEVAIYRYDGHEITDQFISLVNPDADITPFVQKLTGITPKMVKTAPKFHEIAKRIVEITEGTTLVGHNIDFDYRMLRQEFQRLGYDYKINTLDTIPLAKKLIPEATSYSLGKLVKSLGIPLTEQHRAGGDARATLDLFKLLMIKDKNSEIIQTQHEETNAKTYINRIKTLTQDLPSERGIIYFQNSEGKIILSDFVDDLSKFAKNLFNSRSKKWAAVQEETEQIKYDLVGNNVIAKLMMLSKGIKRRDSLPYGLYHKNDNYLVEKTAFRKNETPLVKFKSYSQGLKALNLINANPKFSDSGFFSSFLSLKKRSELWLSEGRVLGEKAFLVFEKGNLKSYGFYSLYKQVENRNSINQLKIQVESTNADIQNELKLSLLRGDFEIQALPD